MNLKDKVALITGAGRGIGRAIAIELARQGAKVACTARSLDQLRETERLIVADGGTALSTAADVTDAADVEQLVAQAIDRFGRIDILVNNAGSFRAVGACWEVDPETWWGDFEVNVKGSFLCCHAVVPRMIEQGEGIVINMAGGGVDRPFVGASGYGSSKTGLMRFTDTLAFELQQAGHAGIQVYAFDPGFVRSAMTEHVPETTGGQKWIPDMQKWLDLGKDHPAQEAADGIVKLIGISKPALSGRIFVWHQNFAEIDRRAEDIQARDSFQIRYLTNF